MRADDARRLRIVAVGEDVGQRVLADVAAGLGDHQQHGDVGDQPAHRVHEAVVAPDRDQARDAEERRRRQVVAGDRPAVLQAGDAAAGGVEVGGALDALGGEVGDEHRQCDDRAEDQEGEPAPLVGDRALRERRGGDGGRPAARTPNAMRDRCVHFVTSVAFSASRIELRGHRVELGVGAARVDERDAPGDDELGQREQEADVDRPPDLDAEELLEIRGADRQQEVVEHREDHQAPEEAGSSSGAVPGIADRRRSPASRGLVGAAAAMSYPPEFDFFEHRCSGTPPPSAETGRHPPAPVRRSPSGRPRHPPLRGLTHVADLAARRAPAGQDARWQEGGAAAPQHSRAAL